MCQIPCKCTHIWPTKLIPIWTKLIQAFLADALELMEKFISHSSGKLCFVLLSTTDPLFFTRWWIWKQNLKLCSDVVSPVTNRFQIYDCVDLVKDFQEGWSHVPFSEILMMNERGAKNDPSGEMKCIYCLVLLFLLFCFLWMLILCHLMYSNLVVLRVLAWTLLQTYSNLNRPLWLSRS